MSNVGRKSKLTPELREEIVKLIKNGNYVEVACQAVNISQASYYGWKARGEKEKRGRYFEFLEAIKKAEAEGEALYLGIVQSAAQQGTWQAAAWYLERRYPQKWGKREQMDITSKGEKLSNILEIKAVDYRASITDLAPRPMGDSDAPGQSESPVDGQEMG